MSGWAAAVVDYLRGLAWIAVREWMALFVVPLGYVVACLFLLIQGWNFALLLHALNDPLAAPGPVMGFFFGGSFFVFWLPVAFVCAVVGMRLFAEERRQGTFDVLLAAPVRPSQIVLGKYLGACGTYVALWAPTGLLVVLLRGAGAQPDLGPVASGYLGTLVVGMTFLAVAAAVGARARQPLAAAAGAFVVLLAMVLAGLWTDEAPAGIVHRLLAATSLLAFMQEVAQGIVDGGRIAAYAAVVAVALRVAVHQVDPHRTRAGLVRTVAFAVTAASLAGIAARRLPRSDWTATAIYTLSEAAARHLARLDAPVRVDVLVPAVLAADQPNPLRRELDEVLRRMARRTEHLSVRFLDPDRDREEAVARIEAFGVAADELVEGVVLVESVRPSGRRRTYLRAPDLVTYATGPQAAATGPRITAFRGEAALVRAFHRVTRDEPATVCVTQGHGEPALDDLSPYGGIVHLARMLQDDGAEVVRLVEPDRVTGCDVVLVPGPRQPLDRSLVEALGGHLRAGGGLVVFAGAVLLRDRDRLARSGLETLLAEHGIVPGERVVVDPHARPGATAYLAFTRDDGWTDAPAVAHLVGRPVSFVLARELSVAPAGPGAGPEPWFVAREEAWAEADLAGLRDGAPPTFDEGADGAPPLPLVAAAGTPQAGRVVVVASDQILLNAHMRPDLTYDATRDLVRTVVAHAAGEAPLAGLEARPRETVKLVLRPAQLRRMTWWAVFGPAGLVALLGLLVALGRRRRAW